MADAQTSMESFSSLLLLAFDQGALTRLIISKPNDKDLPRKLTGQAVTHRGSPVLTVEAAYEGARVTHKRYNRDELTAAVKEWCTHYGQINLMTSCGEASCLLSRRGAICTLRGASSLFNKLSAQDKQEITLGLQHQKSRILSGAEPFLTELGIASKDGRIHDKRQAKFRQINRFLEIVRDVYAALPADGPLTIYDLCCGKSYLSFALYHYLTAVCGRRVSMLCIDLKQDVMQDCAAIAAKLQYDGMEFRCDDVRNTPAGISPDLLVSLHACDVATDIVLETGIALEAKVILSTPCCHRALSEKISCAALDFTTRHPQLRTKLCEALTDGLRLLNLQKNGYAVTALELTDPENTPKNTLLRAVFGGKQAKSSSRAKRAAQEYDRTLLFLMGSDSHD